jgi:hypothetical protein
MLWEGNMERIWQSEPGKSHTPFAPLVRYNSHDPNAATMIMIMKYDQVAGMNNRTKETLRRTTASHDLLLCSEKMPD